MYIGGCIYLYIICFLLCEYPHSFKKALPGTGNHILSLFELLARSYHDIAACLFELDDGVHKHNVYEAWRDASVDPLLNPLTRTFWRPSAFCHEAYSFHY